MQEFYFIDININIFSMLVNYFVYMFMYIGYFCIAVGMLFMLTAMVGFTKFKEPFKMMHVAGVCDLMAGPFIMLGCGFLFINNGQSNIFFKIICLIIITYFISPSSTNAISETSSKIYKVHLPEEVTKTESKTTNNR